jgi:regulator of sigma E protease
MTNIFLWIIENWFFVVMAIFGFGLLILVHEWGHYIACRWVGIRVEKFSIGFGRPLFKFTHKETVFQIAWLPLGGYVKPAGEMLPEEDGKIPAEGEMRSKPWYKRMVVLWAGVVMNIIFAFVLLFLVYFLIGRPMMVAPPVVDSVVENSAAAKAGIKPGDQILKIDQQWALNYEALAELVDSKARSHPGVPLKVLVQRGENQKELEVLARLNPDLGKYLMGVQVKPGPPPVQRTVEKVFPLTPAETAGLKSKDEILAVDGRELKNALDFPAMFANSEHEMVEIKVARDNEIINLKAARKQPVDPKDVDLSRIGLLGLEFELDEELKQAWEHPYQRMSFKQALEFSVWENVFFAGMMVKGLWMVVSGKISAKENVGGPVAILRIAKDQAQTGWVVFLQFLSRISLLLGIFNLLPIPALDGGHIMFTALEAVRGKPLPAKIENMITALFFYFLMGLILLVTFNDLSRLFVN